PLGDDRGGDRLAPTPPLLSRLRIKGEHPGAPRDDEGVAHHAEVAIRTHERRAGPSGVSRPHQHPVLLAIVRRAVAEDRFARPDRVATVVARVLESVPATPLRRRTPHLVAKRAARTV